MFTKHNIDVGDLVRLSIQYHLRTNNGYLRLFKYPDNPVAQEDVVSLAKTMQGPSIDLTCPMQIPPPLYLGQKTFQARTYGAQGTWLVNHVVHLFLFETTIYFWLTKDADEDLFYQWFEPVNKKK